MGNEKDLGYDIFEDVPAGNFLKLKDGEEHIIGVHSRRCDYVSYGKDEKGNPKPGKPSVILELDHVDGPLKEHVEFTTSAKYLKEIIEEYEKAGKDEPNLFSWLFKIKRKGTELDTKYTLMPIKARKAAK